jgi:hypothetical protein
VFEHDDEPLDRDELDALERLVSNASPAPWVASVEGRDHWSGDSFIMVGDPREEDIYVHRETTMAAPADLDFIAAARNYVPRRLAELRRLRGHS